MIHVQPTAPLAERVLLPGDPGRALRLAQALTDTPRMFNHNRGLWGYTGTAPDGAPVTIQATGMGGPSCAIVVHELIELGARRFVRVGTCGALSDAIGLGELLVATAALAADGTSRALGADGLVEPSAELRDGLLAAGPVRSGPIVTTDLFYEPRVEPESWVRAGVLAVEMESSVLFTLAQRRGVAAATALVVSDRAFGDHARIEPESLHAAEVALGRLALAALEAP